MNLLVVIFQSTQPEWAATNRFKYQSEMLAISIHAARVGCDKERSIILDELDVISIHAARVGCDFHYLHKNVHEHISIHAARVGCDMFL